MAEIGNVTFRVNAVITDEQYHEAMSAVSAANERMDLLEDENTKLRELCSELLRMAESNDPDFLHWPEIHDELRELGVEVDR